MQIIVRTLGAALMLTSVASLAAVQDRLPEGEGKVTVETSCTSRCHMAATVMRSKRTPTGWEQVMDLMIERGAEVTDADYDIIHEYLSTHLLATVNVNVEAGGADCRGPRDQRQGGGRDRRLSQQTGTLQNVGGRRESARRRREDHRGEKGPARISLGGVGGKLVADAAGATRAVAVRMWLFARLAAEPRDDWPLTHPTELARRLAP